MADVDFERLQFLSFDADRPYEYYHDDGIARDYDNPDNIRWIQP